MQRKISERLVTQIDFSCLFDSFKMSSDSRHVTFVAKSGNKWFVVVDGKEKKQYDAIVVLGRGKIVFDTPTSLHYLAQNGKSIYLVEENIE